jgi:hypothetical protein
MPLRSSKWQGWINLNGHACWSEKSFKESTRKYKEVMGDIREPGKRLDFDPTFYDKFLLYRISDIQ